MKNMYINYLVQVVTPIDDNYTRTSERYYNTSIITTFEYTIILSQDCQKCGIGNTCKIKQEGEFLIDFMNCDIQKIINVLA